MDFGLIELVLWGGLVFFFWALKDGLTHIESDIGSPELAEDKNFPGKHQPAHLKQCVCPEHLLELIGSYLDAPIYRYAFIDGRKYQFDRICVPENIARLDRDERWVTPGLVYLECRSME